MKKTLIFLFLILTGIIYSQDLAPIYITPYYFTQPLKIKVGKYSKFLLKDNTSDLLKTVNDIKNEIDNVNIETLYILSIRLYDLKLKDEAIYWFYFAQFRARNFKLMLDKTKIGNIGSPAFEFIWAINSFNQLIGEYINGYGFGDIDKLTEIMKNVYDDNINPKNYLKIYKNIKFKDDSNFLLYNEHNLQGMLESIKMYQEKKDYIKEQRIENGINDKY
jgi:hypothetical protein